MDFTPSEEQRELAGLVRRITSGRLTQDRLKESEAEPAHVDRELWRALADAGVLGAALPGTVGGGGLDFLELCSVLVELGRAIAPVPYLTSTVSAAALAYFGTDAQRSAWAAPAARGELVLTAALAEDLDDDPERPATRAQRTDSGWQMTGAKAVVPFGRVADAFLVPVTTAEGVKLFVVLPSDAGVRLRAQRIVDGDIEAGIELAGVQLGEDRLVPGADVVHWLVARVTVGECAVQLGVLERVLELTAEYARQHQQFGRQIGSFQAVAQRVADGYVDVEAVRLTMWKAAWRIASALPCPTEIATAKFWAADAGHRATERLRRLARELADCGSPAP
jgi:acyl-CoA dehydrogenase